MEMAETVCVRHCPWCKMRCWPCHGGSRHYWRCRSSRRSCRCSQAERGYAR
jgi:hypothetical protein